VKHVGWATFLPILVLLGLFVVDLSDAQRDLTTLTFDLGGRGVCLYDRPTSLRAPSVYQV